jgi:hypothetical protein
LKKLKKGIIFAPVIIFAIIGIIATLQLAPIAYAYHKSGWNVVIAGSWYNAPNLGISCEEELDEYYTLGKFFIYTTKSTPQKTYPPGTEFNYGWNIQTVEYSTPAGWYTVQADCGFVMIPIEDNGEDVQGI